MKNKIVILIVCLVLASFGFTAASAEDTETVTTITCKPGSLLADYNEVNQICDIASLRLHSLSGGYGALVLSLGEVDVMTNLLLTDENGFYLQNEMLGDKPLYFNWEDLNKLISEQMENAPNMQMMGTTFDKEKMQSMMDGSMTDEQALEMMGYDQETIDFINDIMESATVETGAFSLEGSDIANQKTVILLTKEDLARALDLPIVRKQISSQLMMSSPSLSEADVNKEVDAQLAAAKQELEDSNLNVTFTKYETDGEFVALQVVVNGSNTDQTNAGLNLTITKTTIGTAKYYQMSLNLYEGEKEYMNENGSLYISDEFISGKMSLNTFDSEPVLSAQFNCDRSQADQVNGELMFTVYSDAGVNSVLVTFSKNAMENVTDVAINAYVGASVADIKASLDTTDLISFKIHSVTQPDSGFFTALQNVTPETSVQPLKMTEDELNDYVMSIQQTFMTGFMTLVSNLPPDISDVLMQEMGAY